MQELTDSNGARLESERDVIWFSFWSPFCVFDRLPKKIDIFAWWHLFSGRREDRFQNRTFLSKKDMIFPSDFVKLGSEKLYLFLAEKMVVCLVFFNRYLVRCWVSFLNCNSSLRDVLRQMQYCTSNPRWIVFELWGFTPRFRFWLFLQICKDQMQLSYNF